ncbi:MAG TPA: serine protease, partial [Chthoniobacterales bacterium]|nr:serine protease [Chthoniobacterales bacterium]
VADGSLSASDLAWDEAKSAWKPISEFLAALSAAKSEAAAPSVSSASADSQAKLESPDAAHRAAVTEEPKAEAPSPSEAKPEVTPARVTPPPLPTMPIPPAGPPPLPTVVPSATSPVAPPSPHEPPEGETIWSPYMAIFGSILLTPAFGGFIIWRNWLRMNRRRRAMVAAPWFWLGFVIIALLFYSRDRLVWIIWLAYLLAWIGFSAYPQIRYVNTTFKRERLRSGLPFVAACFLFFAGSVTYWLTSPKPIVTTPTLEPSHEQTVSTQQLSQSHDRVFTADELRDIYKSSVLEVRTTWKEKRSTFNKKDNGASGTGVLLYNDSEYGLVATNWHVVDPGENMTSDYKCGVRFSHEKDFADVEVVAKAKNDVDLALLLVRLEGKWTPNQFPIRRLDAIKEGEACIAIGNALGEGLSITAGIISRFDKVKDQTLIRTSTPVSPGNSGGPLILERGGSLAGIVTLQSRITNVQNVNFATPAQYLLDKDIWDFESGADKAHELLDKAIAQAKK